MPQMSPMWWLTLMLMFNMILITCNTMMYFNKEISKMKTYTKYQNLFKWMW